MIIKDVVDLAKYSELSSLSIKDNVDAIVAFINLGMLELYTRFPIKVKEHIITVDVNETYYTMPNDFMYPTYVYKEAAADSLEQSLELSINDSDDPYSVYFTDWKTLQLPEPSEGSFVAVLYVTKPARITVIEAEDGITELDLPDMLVDCLLSYIGYRGHLGVKSDGQSEATAQWRRFERNCRKALEYGIAFPQESLTMSERLATRGFA